MANEESIKDLNNVFSVLGVDATKAETRLLIINSNGLLVDVGTIADVDINDISKGTQTNDIKITLDGEVVQAKHLSGTGDNDVVDLTSANTAYDVPASPPASPYTMVLFNGDSNDIYWGFEDTNANGVLIAPNGMVSLDLAASQKVYCYSATAGADITFSYKEV